MTAVRPPPTNELAVLQTFRRQSSAPRLRSMRQFAEEELVIPNGTYGGRRFRVQRQPYTGLLFAAMEGPWRRKVITGSSQSGKTLSAFVAPILYHLFEIGETVVVGIPSMEMARNKWELDIKPVIEKTRYADLLPRKGGGSKGGTPETLTFGHGQTLRFMGAQGGSRGDKQRAGFTTRVVVITETDGMDTASVSSREADPISQFEARTLSFDRRAMIYMECTVSTTAGRTWREYEGGTQSRIVVPCPHCGLWETPEQAHLHGWENAPSKIAAGEQAFFACSACGEAWSIEQREQMNRAAKLLHRGEMIDPQGVITGSPPHTDTLGFRWNAFNNLFVSVAHLGEQAWLTKHAETGSDALERKLKQFLWCEPMPENSIERSELSVGIVRGSDPDYAGRCDGRQRGEVPAGTEFITAGIDIGKRFLTWEIVGWNGVDAAVIDYGMYETSQPDVVGEEQAIRDALQELRKEMDARWAIDAGCVDSGHWSQTVTATVKPWGRPWYCCEGVAGYRHPAKTDREKQVSSTGARFYWHRLDRIIRHDPDSGKHRVHAQFLVRPLTDEGQYRAGACRLWGADPLVHSEFARQITAETFQREWTDRKGYKDMWVKVRRDNHLLDTHVLNLLGRSIIDTLAPAPTLSLPTVRRNPER